MVPVKTTRKYGGIHSGKDWKEVEEENLGQTEKGGIPIKHEFRPVTEVPSIKTIKSFTVRFIPRIKVPTLKKGSLIGEFNNID